MWGDQSGTATPMRRLIAVAWKVSQVITIIISSRVCHWVTIPRATTRPLAHAGGWEMFSDTRSKQHKDKVIAELR